MKKILAIFLALMMIMSVSLAACSKDEPNSNIDDDDDNGYVDKSTDSSDTSFDSSKNPTDTNNSSNSKPSSLVWTDNNDTVYVRHSTYLRNSASSNDKSGIVVELGDSLTRKACSNGVWDKVDYDGNTYYIYNYLLTVSKAEVTFNNITPVATSVINTGTTDQPTTLNLRTTPCYDESLDNLAVSGLTKADTSNGELKVTGLNQSETWARVEYTDKNGKTGTYYCRPNYLEYFQVPEDTSNSGGVTPV